MASILTAIWDFFGTSAISAAFLAAIGFMFRNTLVEYISGKIDYKNKEQLTKLEDQLNRERSEIADIRQIVVSGSRLRNEKLIEKQISATEALWAALHSNKKHSFAVKFLQSVNIEAIDKKIRERKISEFVDVMSQTTGVDKLIGDAGKKQISATDGQKAELARPFVSPVAWALYSAHTSISFHAVATIIAWKNKVTTKLLVNEELVQAAKKALPHQTQFIEKYGVPGTYYLLDEIEEALLAELKRFLKSGTTDQEAVENAREILAATAKVQASLSHPPSTP